MKPLKSFALGILAGTGSVLAGLAAVYAALVVAWPDKLPAPALSPMVHLDEKLRFLRDHPEFDPRIIAVGSSITWRQVVGTEFTPLAGGAEHFLNGATAQLQIDQTHALTEFYLDVYPNIRTVLVMTSLPDFEGCAGEGHLMDIRDARSYVSNGLPEPYFYLRYFSPQRYARGVMTLSKRRTPFTGDLYIDDYGSGPVKLPETVSLGLRYEDIRRDPACVAALAAFLKAMSGRGIRTFVVLAPVHPEYRRRYPEAMQQLNEIADGLQTSPPAGTGLLLLQDDPRFEAGDFYDAFHLEYPGARRLSEIVAEAMSRHDSLPALTGEVPAFTAL